MHQGNFFRPSPFHDNYLHNLFPQLSSHNLLPFTTNASAPLWLSDCSLRHFLSNTVSAMWRHHCIAISICATRKCTISRCSVSISRCAISQCTRPLFWQLPAHLVNSTGPVLHHHAVQRALYTESEHPVATARLRRSISVLPCCFLCHFLCHAAVPLCTYVTSSKCVPIVQGNGPFAVEFLDPSLAERSTSEPTAFTSELPKFCQFLFILVHCSHAKTVLLHCSHATKSNTSDASTVSCSFQLTDAVRGSVHYTPVRLTTGAPQPVCAAV